MRAARLWVVAAAAAALLLAVGVAFAQGDDPFAGLELELVAEGMTSPVALASPPEDGRLFVVDQIGVVHLLAADGTLLDEPFLDVRDQPVDLRDGFDERGLLGPASDPGYGETGQVWRLVGGN